jgi:hypothetical protein
MKIPDNAHSVIHNYAIAGMDSYIIGDPADRTRLLHMTRHQLDYVTPHSHKTDLTCTVLNGMVINTIFTKGKGGDYFIKTPLIYQGEAGKYVKQKSQAKKMYVLDIKGYHSRQQYSMPYYDIHSIWFTKGAMLLLKSGDVVTDATFILEPYSNFRHVQNFHVHKGLFKK